MQSIITYLPDKNHVETLKKTLYRGAEYSENLEETAGKIRKNWQQFDEVIDSHSNTLSYFQHSTNYCTARIGRRTLQGFPLFSIKFSSIEKKVLMETLKEFGLPFDDSNVREGI